MFCLFGLVTDAQSLFEDHPVRHIGPGTMSGRVTALDVDPTDRDIIYAGTASGGLWRSTSSGANWEPLFDDQDILSIGSVAVAPSNPDVIWAGTGEGNPRNSHTSGRGIYRSIDGGYVVHDGPRGHAHHSPDPHSPHRPEDGVCRCHGFSLGPQPGARGLPDPGWRRNLGPRPVDR